MSETTKKPAHEVCLDLLTEAVDDLCKFDESYNLGAPDLCVVLSLMIIPDKHRKEIIERLCKLLERCIKWDEEHTPSSTNMRTPLERLLNKLNTEDEDKLKSEA